MSAGRSAAAFAGTAASRPIAIQDFRYCFALIGVEVPCTRAQRDAIQKNLNTRSLLRIHHTAEDTGIVIGQAIAKALGDKAGIVRYADVHLPMDETLTRVAVDVSGRPFLIWKANFSRHKVGEMDTELFREWFQAFAQNAGITLHVENLYGENNHHIAETCYKGLARALRLAIAHDPRQAGRIPSTKGMLTG